MIRNIRNSTVPYILRKLRLRDLIILYCHWSKDVRYVVDLITLSVLYHFNCRKLTNLFFCFRYKQAKQNIERRAGHFISLQSSVIISLLSSCFGLQSKCTISYLVFQLSNSNIFDSTGDWLLISSFKGDWYLISSLTGDWYLISSFKGDWSLRRTRRTIEYYWLSENYWILFITRELLITIDYYW